MNSATVDAAAQALITARREHRWHPHLPADQKPADLDAAYAIQARLVALSEEELGGWKIAVGSSLTPICSPIPASAYARDGSDLDIAGTGTDLVEAEIAVRLVKDLPQRGTPYGEDDIIAAIGALHPALEFIGPGGDPLTDIANFQRNSAVVTGAALTDWQEIETGTVAITLSVGEETLTIDTGASRADTIAALTWLANGRAQEFGGLRTGQVIITGSRVNTGVGTGSKAITARFSGLGDVGVKSR